MWDFIAGCVIWPVFIVWFASLVIGACSSGRPAEIDLSPNNVERLSGVRPRYYLAHGRGVRVERQPKYSGGRRSRQMASYRR